MSQQVTQREATYNAIKSVLTSNNITFEDGMNTKEVLTSEMKKEIRSILFEGFRSGSIDYSENFAKNKLNNDSELNKYCTGLISNWTSKDQRLNGGVKHEIKNPGSRAGQGDEQVRELRKVLKKVAGTEHEAEVQKALDARIAEVKASKAPSVQINVDALPEHLRHLAEK